MSKDFWHPRMDEKGYQPSGISKAEDAAMKTYPDDRFLDGTYADMCRGFFKEGYQQAEKDLEWEVNHREEAYMNGVKDGLKERLTIEDLELLHTFLYAVKNNKSGCFTFTRLSDEQYQEVLRRFNERKQ